MSDKKDNAEVLSTALARFKVAVSATSDSRNVQLEDLKFLAGNSDNNWQWPGYARDTRLSATTGVTARPMLTINKMPQHVNQITNDQRQNNPQGKVIPSDSNASPEVAEILNGMVRHIQQASDADVAYSTACEQQVIHGEGFWRIITKYVSPISFDQEIFIERIKNSFSVYIDPMIQRPCGEDAQWAMIVEDLTKDEYERQFPDASPMSTLLDAGIGNSDLRSWITKGTVRIAEYFHIECTSKKLNLYEDGTALFADSPEAKQYEMTGMVPVKTRDAEQKQVKWCKINGYEVLETQVWPGEHIPVIRVVGNEYFIEGETHVSGIVRNSKDAQRMYNYHSSQEVEMLALAPKAPFIGYGGQFEGYEDKWKTANINPWPYLEVNPDVTDGNGGPMPLPQRAQPPMVQSGLIAAKQAASEDIKSTTGQYNASLGQQGNERSGKAILARQKEGDVGTYHYVDNLSRAIRYTTRQLIDLIPKIYDTARIARTLGEDGKTSKMVKLDPQQRQPVNEIKDEQGIVIDKIYNPGVGKYDVIAITGPGYASKRQEAAEAMVTLLQTNPELMSLIGDEVVESMDWPGAERIAKRIRKSMDPKLLDEEGENPALQQAQQQIEQMGQQLQQAQSMLQNVQKSMEAREIAIKEQEVQIKAYDAETKRIQATAAGMSLEQIQEIVRGTIDAAVQTGDLSPGNVPMQPQMPEPQPMMAPEPQMPQQPMMQEPQAPPQMM